MSLRLTEKDRKVLEAFTAKNGVSNIPMAGTWLEENRKFSISRRSLIPSMTSTRLKRGRM